MIDKANGECGCCCNHASKEEVKAPEKKITPLGAFCKMIWLLFLLYFFGSLVFTCLKNLVS